MQGGIMATTKDVREAVRAELDFDPLVEAADITFKNMTGDVALNGTVPNHPQYLEAAAAARRDAGGTSVHNHLGAFLPAAHDRGNAMLTTAASHARMTTITAPD